MKETRIGLSVLTTALVITLALTLVSDVSAQRKGGPGRPPDPGGQGSIAVMVVSFDLDTVLQGTFAVQNKDWEKNGTITVPDGGDFQILLEERVDREWRAIPVVCMFYPSSVDLPDDGFWPVMFDCTGVDMDENPVPIAVDGNATSVRVTAIVPLEGRLFLKRLDQKIP